MKRNFGLLIVASMLVCPVWAVNQAELVQMPEALSETMRSCEAEMIESLNGWNNELKQPREFTAEDIDYLSAYPIYQHWDGMSLNGMNDPENATWIVPVKAGEEQIWLEFYIKPEIPEEAISNLTEEELEQEQEKVGHWVFGGSGLMESDHKDYQTMMDTYEEQKKVPESSDYVLTYVDAHSVVAIIRENNQLTGAIPLDPVVIPSKGRSSEATLEVGTVYDMKEIGAAIEAIQAQQNSNDVADIAEQRDGGESTQQNTKNEIVLPLVIIVGLCTGAFLLYRRRGGKKS